MPRITTDVLDGYSLELQPGSTGVDIIASSESEEHRVHTPLSWENIATLHSGLTQLLEHHRTQGTPVADEGDATTILREQHADEAETPNAGTPARDELTAALAAIEANEEASAALDAAPDAEARCRRCGARDVADCTELPGGPARWAVEVIEEKAEQGCSVALGVVNA